MNKNYAGFWRRFGGGALDGILISVVNVGLSMIFVSAGLLNPENSEIVTSADIGVLIMLFVLNILYFVAPIEVWGGTPGMLALGMQMQDLSGQKPSMGRVIGWYFARVISGFTLGIGYLMIAWTEKKQGLHDKIAGTVFVTK